MRKSRIFKEKALVYSVEDYMMQSFKSVFSFCFLMALSLMAVTGQTLSTPREAIENVHKHWEDNPEQALKSLDVSGLEEKEQKKVLRKLALLINSGQVLQAKMPEQAAYYDTLKGHFEPFPELKPIWMERKGNNWRFSTASVQAIPDVYHEQFPFAVKVVHKFSDGRTKKLFGFPVWKMLGLGILIAMLVLVHWMLMLLTEPIFKRLLRKYQEVLEPKKFTQPLSFMAVSLLLVFFLPALQLGPEVGAWSLKIAKVTVPVFTTILFYRMVDLVSDHLMYLASLTEGTLDDQLVPLVRKTLKVFVVVLGVLFGLQNLDFNIMSLVAGLSISGIAVALAAQDTIKNFFGSVMIFVDRPFQIGDWIVADGIDGDVEEVGFRSTRIRTFHNSVTSIPNGKIADMCVDNMGQRKYRRYKTYITVTYDTSPEKLDAFVEGMRQIVLDHPLTRKDSFHVYFNTFGAHSLDILFYIFFKVPDWGAELKARHEVNLAIMRLAQKMGVEFAFPTQTIHMETGDSSKGLTDEEVKREMATITQK